MAGLKLLSYIAALVVNPGRANETTRDSTTILATNDADAVEKAQDWAKSRAVDGDVLQIKIDNRGVRVIPIRKVS